MSNRASTEQITNDDAAKLEEAVKAIAESNFSKAHRLLEEIIANTPADYQHVKEGNDGGLTIQFWSQADFIHYVAWMQEHPPVRGIVWEANIYPRAHHYMGFLFVKMSRFIEAITYLRKGLELEPTSPMIQFELAQALIRSGDAAGGLAIYESVKEPGFFVSRQMLAMGYRGRGFALIEMEKLDDAEAALKKSLEIEPGHPVAVHELEFIADLRENGGQVRTESVESQVDSPLKCASCGKRMTSGKVANIDGVTVGMCDRCLSGKAPKKWWQFWRS